MEMTAVSAENSQIKLIQVEQPIVKPDEVLVQFKAVSLNQADLLVKNGQSHGGWKTDKKKILGMEFSGIIIEVGSQVTGYKVGDRVMSVGSQTLDELISVNPLSLMKIPDLLTYEEAAALPVGIQTLTDALFMTGNFSKGQTVFFQGASSAMGFVGMQMAQLFGAKTVIGSSRSSEKRKKLEAYGCDVFIDTSSSNWSDQVIAATDGKGTDLVIDFLSGNFINDTMKATKPGGTIVNVGRMSGTKGTFDFDLHNMRRIKYYGASFRLRTLPETLKIISKTKELVEPKLDSGKLKMPIDSIFSLKEAQKAFQKLESGKNFGKIVISFESGE